MDHFSLGTNGLPNKRHLLIVVAAAVALFSSCGGGSSGPPPPPVGTFTIVVTPSPLGIAPGSNSTVQVSLQIQNGFSNPVSLTVTGLPAGITIQPSSFSLTPGGLSQSVVVSAQGNVAPGTYSGALQGSGGGQSSPASLSVQVGQLATFTFRQPNSPNILARIGSPVPTQTQIQTQTCCTPAIAGYLLNLSVGALPPNVTASFSPNPVVVGNATTLTISADSNAVAVQNLPLAVMATADAQVAPQQLGLTLDVTPLPGNLPNNRTDFIRMDGTPVSIVYDPMHQLIYASNLEWNRVDIISPVTKQIVRSIPIPTPLGLDISPDGSRVYVSSQTQRMFAIDTAKQRLVQSWSLPQSNAVPGVVNGAEYGVLQVVALSNGNVLLFANQIFTTSVGLIKWNPASNTVSTLPFPPTFQIGGMSRSGDGSKVIIFGGSEPGSAVIYDAPSDSFTASINYPFFVNSVQADPTGTRFIIFDLVGGLRLYDAQLNDLGPIPPGADDTGVVFSPDGSLIYVVADDHGVPATYTVRTATLALIGIAPAYDSIPPHATLDPPFIIEMPFAADSTGLIFGAADHGLALDDSTFFQGFSGSAGAPTFDKLVEPDAGPVNAATPVTVVTAPFSVLPDAWFGDQHGTNETLVNGNDLQVSAPPASQPGPVNLKIIQPNGAQTFDPLAYSYGPAPLFVSGDAGSPDGGATADIIAVGVPSDDPSSIQVSVGGANANVISAKIFPSTFPTVDVQVQLPAGTPGDADLRVTTTAGSATLPKAFQFAESVKDYPSPDTFQAVTYDRFRNQLYLSAGDHVDVFSLAGNQFIAPLALPSAGGKKQFAGMALTPDGSQLVVANLMDGSVDIVSPDQPSAAVAIPIAPAFLGIDGPPCFIGPSYVATTNTGKVFIVYGGLIAINCGPGGPVYQLDLSTKAVNQLSIAVCNEQAASFVASSRDGSKVAMGGSVSGAGRWCIYDTASNSYASSIFFQPFGAAIAGDGNFFAAGFRITDGKGILLNIMAFPEPFYPGQLPGTPEGNGVNPQYLEKMNDSGSLLYVPFPNTVDIFDVAHGILRRRVTLRGQIPQIVDALAIDLAGKEIFAITNAGLTVIELSAVPLSIGSVTPSGGPPGTVMQIRGSGFTTGTTVTFDGSTASSKFVDADTLSATVPSLTTGPIQATLSNPEGQIYTLDDVFTAQ
jgi:hypothetical protein